MNDGIKLNATQNKIVDLLKENSQYTIDILAALVGVKHRTIERNLKTLKDKGTIKNMVQKRRSMG